MHVHVYSSCVGDGLLDSQEGIQDIDGDGLPNFVDKDSDGEPEHAEFHFLFYKNQRCGRCVWHPY